MELPLLPLSLARVPEGLRQVLDQEGVPIQPWQPAAMATRFVLYDGQCAPPPELAPGQEAIDVDRFRLGAAGDPFAPLVDTKASLHRWRLGDWDVMEEIGQVNRRSVRKRLVWQLRKEIEFRGGTWLTLGGFPFPYRSAFNFRFDHDEFHAADFERTLNAISGWEAATSHYVCASTHEKHSAALERLRGLHVGSHGYWHHTYLDQADNERNIRRGIEVLQQAGLQPVGFVAPHGRSNAGLRAALNHLSIDHSSEFGLAHDELPFFPPGSRVLQIPIHPLCLGVVIEAASAAAGHRPPVDEDGRCKLFRRAAKATLEHFEAVARRKYESGEPVFLYGHPDGRVGRYPELLQETLNVIAGFGSIWKTTLAEFAAWWRQRQAIRLQLQRSGDNLVVSGQLPAASNRVSLHLWRGDLVATLPWDGAELKLQTSSLAYQRRSFKASGFQPVRVDGAQPLKSALLRYLDWERVTPVKEIHIRDWRSLVKKTLRMLKS